MVVVCAPSCTWVARCSITAADVARHQMDVTDLLAKRYLPHAIRAAEAIRNVVAVGADPASVALLDNFSWGDPRRPSTLGELVAWMIGWDLMLEYGLAASAVAVGWSGYLQSLLASYGFGLPTALIIAAAALAMTDATVWPLLLVSSSVMLLKVIVPLLSSTALAVPRP